MNLKPSRLVPLFAAFVFLFSLAPAGAQVLKPAPRNAGSISGRIIVDGKPKAGLKVELIKIGPDGFRQAKIMSVPTSKTGRYMFRGVRAGIYDVSPDTPNVFVPDEGRSGSPGKSVVIEPGENVTEINFALLSKGSISGRVIDDNGHPVVGEAVEYRLKREDGSVQPINLPQPSDRSTDADGFYHISGLRPGRYVVKVGVPYGLTAHGPTDAQRARYLETFHPDVSESSKALAVEVTSSGETANVDIKVGRPLTTHKIEGQIISDNGALLPDIWLGVMAKSEDGKATNELTGAYRSNSNGQFRIYGAMPGQYVVYPENDETNNLYGEPVSFAVRESDVTGLKISMHSALSITGIVSIEGASDPVTAAELAKLRIVANSLLSEPHTRVLAVPIDSEGGFRIEGVRPGKVALSLAYDSDQTLQRFTILRVERNGIVAPAGIEIGPGQNVSGVRLVLGAGSGVLRGDVQIQGGELEGVRLFVYYRAANRDLDNHAQAELDARGRFVITDLMPGEYELMIGPTTAFLSGDGGRRTRSRMPTVKRHVTIASGGESEVTLVMHLNPTPLEQ